MYHTSGGVVGLLRGLDQLKDRHVYNIDTFLRRYQTIVGVVMVNGEVI